MYVNGIPTMVSLTLHLQVQSNGSLSLLCLSTAAVGGNEDDEDHDDEATDDIENDDDDDDDNKFPFVCTHFFKCLF